MSSASRVVARAGAGPAVVAAFAAAPPCDATVVVRPARSGAAVAGGRGGAAGRAGGTGGAAASWGFVSSAMLNQPSHHEISKLDGCFMKLAGLLVGNLVLQLTNLLTYQFTNYPITSIQSLLSDCLERFQCCLPHLHAAILLAQ